MDEFAQSRGDDDLFDDEITPIPAPTNIPDQTQARRQSDLAGQVEKLSVSSFEPSGPLREAQNMHANRGRGRGRISGGPRGGRGRGMVGQGQGRGGLAESKFAPASAARQGRQGRGEQRTTQAGTQQQPQETLKNTTEPEDGEKGQQTAEPGASASQTETEQTTPHPQTETETEAPAPAPAQANPDTPADNAASPPQPPDAPNPKPPSKPPAVRGDRTSTGGLRPPKLSDHELSTRLALAKQKSQARSEAHARAQADAADFEERERVAGVKRGEEERRSRAMEGERERNRVRKLGGRGGREWDADKGEMEEGGRRYGSGGGIGRGVAGEDVDLRMYEWREDGETGGRGRGRGRGRARGEGRGGRGGRGRGGGEAVRTPDVKAVDDFPALPAAAAAAKKAQGREQQRPQQQQRQDSENAAGGSWADQMAND